MNSRILPLIAIMLSIGMLFAYIHPTWTGPIADTKLAIEKNKEALLAADEYEAKQNELASRRNEIDPGDLERLTVFLPDSVDNVGLILDINALAARSGLSLSNIDVVQNSSQSSDNSSGSFATDSSGALTSSRVDPLGSVNLSLSALGTYTALQAFLIGIEKSARLLDVEDLTVSGSDTGVYSYKMTVRLYWLR